MTEPAFASIVVGTDGSGTAETALRAAVDLARESAARLHIVTAYEPASGEGASSEGPTAARTGEASRDVASVLDGARELARRDGVRQVETFARQGDAADALLGVAAEQAADLIVVGNKGMNSARGLLLGSVPSKVSRLAPCSVWIVRTT